FQLTAKKIALAILAGGLLGFLHSFWWLLLATHLASFILRANGLAILSAGLVMQWGVTKVTDGLPWQLLAVAVASLVGYLLTSYLERRRRRAKAWSGTMRGGRLGNAILKFVTVTFGLRMVYVVAGSFALPYFLF